LGRPDRPLLPRNPSFGYKTPHKGEVYGGPVAIPEAVSVPGQWVYKQQATS
jgi:hypothetical protein